MANAGQHQHAGKPCHPEPSANVVPNQFDRDAGKCSQAPGRAMPTEPRVQNG